MAKLIKDSKSRSGQVHMATVDNQSDHIFSDDDTSKPEDNDYNSDNLSAGSDSEKRDMNVYITHGKKKWITLSRVVVSISPQSLRSLINLSFVR